MFAIKVTTKNETYYADSTGCKRTMIEYAALFLTKNAAWMYAKNVLNLTKFTIEQI